MARGNHWAVESSVSSWPPSPGSHQGTERVWGQQQAGNIEIYYKPIRSYKGASIMVKENEWVSDYEKFHLLKDYNRII